MRGPLALPGWLAGAHRRRRPHRRLVAVLGHRLQPPRRAPPSPRCRRRSPCSQTLWQDGLGRVLDVFQVTITEARDRLRLGQRHRAAAGVDRAAAAAHRDRRHADRRRQLLPAGRRGRRHRDRGAGRREARRRSRRRPRSSSPRSPCSSPRSSARCSASRRPTRLEPRRRAGLRRDRGSRSCARCGSSRRSPAILNALQIAVPTAFLGAVLGEYMGAHRPQRRHHAHPAAGRPRLGAGLGGVPALRRSSRWSATRSSASSPGCVTPWVSGKAVAA